MEIISITTGNNAIYGLGKDSKVYIWRNGKWVTTAAGG